MQKGPLMSVELPGIKLFKRGKVRDIFELGDKFLIVATDRVSAFDVVMSSGIPDKGRILTGLSLFWFDFMKDEMENHVIASEFNEIAKEAGELKDYEDLLKGRSMLVKKAEPLPVECVVRGYLAGSGWKEYKEGRAICGIKLPPDLVESEKLPQPIFTPATKATAGHDINITEEQTEEMVGREVFSQLKAKSLAIYERASKYADSRGIIISDTKFEFGRVDGKIILIDELLTPDSSRFWPKDGYEPGRPQRSFDKQFLRDYLETLHWDKRPPAPPLPEEIIQKTRARYLEAYRRITGCDLL